MYKTYKLRGLKLTKTGMECLVLKTMVALLLEMFILGSLEHQPFSLLFTTFCDYNIFPAHVQGFKLCNTSIHQLLQRMFGYHLKWCKNNNRSL